MANIGADKDDYQFVAVTALSQLDELCKKICNKSITLGSLDMVKQKRDQLKVLCDAVKGYCIPYSQVNPYLEDCIKLQSDFMDYRDKISTLLELCSGISNGMLHHCVTIKTPTKCFE